MKHRTLFLLFICSSLGISAQDLLIRLTPSQLTGDQLTYDVSVENFTDILAMQYTITYDADVVSLVAIENLIIPGMTAANFDTTPGTILSVWFESALSGVTLSDNSVIYQLVFQKKSDANPVVCFSQEPLETEIIQLPENVIDLYVVDDCNSTPILFDEGTTGTQDLVETLGFQINSIAESGSITFNLKESKNISMALVDMSGKVVASFPEKIYHAGQHSIKPSGAIIPGRYMLIVEHQHVRRSANVIFIQ